MERAIKLEFLGSDGKRYGAVVPDSDPNGAELDEEQIQTVAFCFGIPEDAVLVSQSFVSGPPELSSGRERY
jgi:hypothetical protein